MMEHVTAHSGNDPLADDDHQTCQGVGQTCGKGVKRRHKQAVIEDLPNHGRRREQPRTPLKQGLDDHFARGISLDGVDGVARDLGSPQRQQVGGEHNAEGEEHQPAVAEHIRENATQDVSTGGFIHFLCGSHHAAGALCRHITQGSHLPSENG